MKGSILDNVKYCSKEGNFVEFGDRPPEERSRTDLQHLYFAVKSGQSDIDLCENGFFGSWSRNMKACDRVRSYFRPKTEGRKVILHIGRTRTGKTRSVFDKYPDVYETPISGDKTQWYDGYQGQKVALLDEYSGQQTLCNILKIIDEWYVRSVGIKGAFTWWNPHIIYITTNVHPRTWYNWEGREDQEEALRARFNGGIFVFHKDGSIVKQNIKKYWPLECDNDANNALMQRKVPLPPKKIVKAITIPRLDDMDYYKDATPLKSKVYNKKVICVDCLSDIKDCFC